jgi:hypothetical protein
MEPQDFMDKLLAQASLDEVDFACDLERVLADQVKYLRGLLAQRESGERADRDALVCELRTRLEEKDREIASLRGELACLRLRLSG